MTKKLFAALLSLLFLPVLTQAQPGNEWVKINLATGEEKTEYVEEDCDDECELPAREPIEQEELAEDVWLDEGSFYDAENFHTLDWSAEDALYTDQNFTQTTIVNKDNRIDITGRAQGFSKAAVTLEIAFNRNGGLCSGAMVGPHLVLTAAHCLYDQGQMARGIAVVASGLKSKPVSYAVDIWFPVEFAKNKDPFYDIGFVVLEKPLGNTTGVLGLKVIASGTYNKLSTLVLGRGGDKPIRSLWKSYGNIKWVDGGFVFTNAPVVGGNSGGPMIIGGGQITGILTAQIPELTLKEFLKNPFGSVIERIREFLNGTAFYPNIALQIDSGIVRFVKAYNKELEKAFQKQKQKQQQQKKKSQPKKRKRTYHV